MEILFDVWSTFYEKTKDYLPNFLSGLIVLTVGVMLAEVVKHFFTGFVRFIKLHKILKATKIAKEEVVLVWTEVLAELLKWITVLLFLIPTVEVWGLPRLVGILNNLLFYLPNVIVSVIIALVGYILAGLTYDVVLHSVRSVQERVSRSFALAARYAVLVFTALIVLNQLGVAQDLIRILFTGIVFMLTLAGGLAFGLGGREVARDILAELKKNLTRK